MQTRQGTPSTSSNPQSKKNKREYKRVTDSQRIALIKLLKQNVSIKNAAETMGINYENAKAIYRIYRLERRKTQQSTKLPLFAVKMPQNALQRGLRQGPLDFESSQELDQPQTQGMSARRRQKGLLTSRYGRHTLVLFTFDRQSELQRQLLETTSCSTRQESQTAIKDGNHQSRPWAGVAEYGNQFIAPLNHEAFQDVSNEDSGTVRADWELHRSKTSKKVTSLLADFLKTANQENIKEEEDPDSEEEQTLPKFLFESGRVILKQVQGALLDAHKEVLPLQAEISADVLPELNTSTLPLKRTFKGTDLFSNELLDPLAEIVARRGRMSETISYLSREAVHAKLPESATLPRLRESATAVAAESLNSLCPLGVNTEEEEKS